MKKKFFLCFLGCILAGLLLTGSVGAFSFSGDSGLDNSGNDTLAMSGDMAEADATLDDAGDRCFRKGKRWFESKPKVKGKWQGKNPNAAPIPSAVLLLGSGILGLVGIRVRSKRRS